LKNVATFPITMKGLIIFIALIARLVAEAEYQAVLWRDLLEDKKKGEQLELEAPSSQD